MSWKNPKTIIGNTATGSYYYHREDIVENIWEQIEKGNHVLLAAPRRVGKSSIMKYMTNNPLPGYKCIFENIQGIKSEEEFYKKVYSLIKTCLNIAQQSASWLLEFFKELKIEEVSIDGSIKFGGRTINYLEAINQILPKLNDKNVKIVLFIDELPEVLHYLNKNGKKDQATSILKNLRNWRQDDQFKNFCLVLAGSIGIHYVVKSIEGRTTDTNDFGPVNFDPLTLQQALNYISWATDNQATIQYSDEHATYLLNKINHYLPYFINLMLDEINKKARRENNSTITSLDIDNAFESIVKNSDHFRDWKNRIFDYMPSEQADFQNEVLVYIAHNDSINKIKLHDMASKHKLTNHFMELVNGLDRDGYITEQGENYIFLSPFLKTFWKRENPIYNEE